MAKMNIDGAIRAKVLQYKADGNTLTEKWETLTKFSDGIYYNQDTDNWGYTIYPFFFEDNGVYWSAQIAASENQINRPEVRQRIIDTRANFRTIIKEKSTQNAFINTLQIEVMRRLGEDTAPLLASREAYLKQREEEERLRAEEAKRKEQERKEAEKRHNAEELAKGKQNLMEHKAVTAEQIELLAESVGYKIHIRTIGFMREKVTEAVLLEDGTFRVWGYKLTSRNINGTAIVLREIEDRLKAQAEEDARQTAQAAECAVESGRREFITANCLFWDYPSQSIKERVNKLVKVTEHLYYKEDEDDDEFVTIVRCLNGVYWEQQGNATIHIRAFDSGRVEYAKILKELGAYQTAEEFIAKAYQYRLYNGWGTNSFTNEIVRRLSAETEKIAEIVSMTHEISNLIQKHGFQFRIAPANGNLWQLYKDGVAVTDFLSTPQLWQWLMEYDGRIATQSLETPNNMTSKKLKEIEEAFLKEHTSQGQLGLFTGKVNKLYPQLQELGHEARQIITDFVTKQDGSYTINIDEDDHVWIGDDIYATALKLDRQGNVLVFNSGQYSEYLHDMDDYNILDLALYIANLQIH